MTITLLSVYTDCIVGLPSKKHPTNLMLKLRFLDEMSAAARHVIFFVPIQPLRLVVADRSPTSDHFSSHFFFPFSK